MPTSFWRIAGVLFVVGGVLSAGGAALFASQGPGLGSWLTIIGAVLEGAGLILLGLGFRRSSLPPWGPWVFVAAGCLEMLFVFLAVTGTASLGVTITLGVLILILVGIAATVTMATRAARRAVYITLVVLAVCDLINLFSGAPLTLGIVGVVYVLLGIILLRGARPMART